MAFEIYYYICSYEITSVVKQRLNKTELRLLKHLWRIEKGYLKDIEAAYDEPKPAYTTISTLLSRMEKKGYIGFEKTGRDKLYYPILKKNEYFKNQIAGMVSGFFNNSPAQFASFFTKNADFSLEELEDIQRMVEQKINEKKGK